MLTLVLLNFLLNLIVLIKPDSFKIYSFHLWQKKINLF